MPIEIQPPRPPAARPARASSAMSANAAPVIAPEGVSRETGREGSAPAAAGAVVGVESGPPSASTIEGVGVAAAPPPPDRPAAPVRLPSGIRAPVKTVDVAPVYAAIARTAHVQGIVTLEAVLDADGRVDDVHVLAIGPVAESGGNRRGSGAMVLHAHAVQRARGAGRHHGDGDFHAAGSVNRLARERALTAIAAALLLALSVQLRRGERLPSPPGITLVYRVCRRAQRTSRTMSFHRADEGPRHHGPELRLETHRRDFTAKLAQIVTAIGTVPDSAPDEIDSDDVVRLRELVNETSVRRDRAAAGSTARRRQRAAAPGRNSVRAPAPDLGIGGNVAAPRSPELLSSRLPATSPSA